MGCLPPRRCVLLTLARAPAAGWPCCHTVQLVPGGHSPAVCMPVREQVARVAGNIHFAVRPEALFLSKNAEEIKEVRRMGCLA